MASFIGDDKPRFIYATKDKGKYNIISEDEFFKNKKFERKKF